MLETYRKGTKNQNNILYSMFTKVSKGIIAVVQLRVRARKIQDE